MQMVPLSQRIRESVHIFRKFKQLRNKKLCLRRHLSLVARCNPCRRQRAHMSGVYR
ncbi:hypothetical protein X977_3919 [Burkholderia pseudomallei MSHR7504]|nr:hypothetical protein X977_3919 [Burkholderia pseudomallei MSHR7504]